MDLDRVGPPLLAALDEVLTETIAVLTGLHRYVHAWQHLLGVRP